MTLPLFQTGDGDWRPTSDDHYTPAWLFEVMDLQFDLDVAAPPGGVPWIPADRYFTIYDDGLAQQWEGLVWCNPPFTKVSPWARRWNVHPDGVMLAPASKSAWLSESSRASDLLWIPERPLDFIDPDGVDTSVFVMTLVFMRGAGTEARDGLSRVPGTFLAPI